MEDESDVGHYMEATSRMRERAERAEAERDHLQRGLADIHHALYPAEGTIPDDKVATVEYTHLPEAVAGVVAELTRLQDVVTEYNGPDHPPLNGPLGDSDTHCWACLVFIDDNDLTDLAWHKPWCPWRVTKELEIERVIEKPDPHDDDDDDGSDM